MRLARTDTRSASEAELLAKPTTHRSRYRPFRELLRRTFAMDLEHCAKCGARLVLRAPVTAAQSVARFLRRIGEDPNSSPIAPNVAWHADVTIIKLLDGTKAHLQSSSTTTPEGSSRGPLPTDSIR
jgi:hypothetical protein